MKPDAMDRAELLDRVMNNYRRFFMNKSFFQYPWEKDKFRRKYLMGCLKAFLKERFSNAPSTTWGAWATGARRARRT